MDQIQRVELLNRAKDFFRNYIIDAHINKAAAVAGKLKNYNVNPFLFKYLANFLKGNDDPRSIAEALIYPRLLGSSINTIFGMRIQIMINELFQGYGSAVSGIDIEFVDGVDGRKKYCQVKSGPNTINKDDVKTVFDHFQSTRNLARTNNLNIGINDMIVGIVYGDVSELSSHYKKINDQYPVYIGSDFWHRLTGKDDFYLDLINAFGEVALEVDGRGRLEEVIISLTEEIRLKYTP